MIIKKTALFRHSGMAIYDFLAIGEHKYNPNCQRESRYILERERPLEAAFIMDRMGYSAITAFQNT